MATRREARRTLADAAFTLKTGRTEFVHRRIVACEDPAEGAAVLEARDPKRVFTHQQILRDPPVVFMFPGQGAQYAGMGAELYRTEPVFRKEIDTCAEMLRPILKADLRDVMFPSEATRGRKPKNCCCKPASRNPPCSRSNTLWRSCGCPGASGRLP